MSYRISRRANADIEKICDYIAEDTPMPPSKWMPAFTQRFSSLPRFRVWGIRALT